MIPDKTSTANLSKINIIFYAVHGEKSWQNMKRKTVWIITKFTYENIFVILLSGLLLLNQYFTNISILLEWKSNYTDQSHFRK